MIMCVHRSPALRPSSISLIGLHFRFENPIPQLKNVVKAVEDFLVVGDRDDRSVLVKCDLTKQVYDELGK